ncbi:MAG: ATP-grasp domain-containing protein [Verrucomicrobiaceae bacterium]|nr:ATP-grasp domain-containing protein [Verrucomicrobiaceae bacterium]
MNILITSSGRRVELVQLTKECVKKYNGQVIAADASNDAPTAKFCDIFKQIPKISSPDFIPSLLKICKEYKIDILIPTIDTELKTIAENVEKFSAIGVLVNISSYSVIEICRNKINTQRFFEENNILAPSFISPNISSENIKYPVFIKPLDGSSSINAFKVNTAKQLDFFRSYVPNPIVQEMIIGEEYTVDVFCDFNSTPITIVPRRRLAVRSGEILKGKTTRDYAIIKASIDLVEKLKPFGHITLQCIKNDTGIYFIEINPRFGGGAPMSIVAGANSIENLIKLKKGEKLSYNEDWKDNIIFSRFDNSVII